MLTKGKQMEFSVHTELYDKCVPKNHVLRRMNELVDFSFVYDELKDKYCPDNGRNAISPIMMFKYLILKVMYKLSDADLVEACMSDLRYKYFLGLNPEDDVINPSSLTKFRKLRLKDEDFLDKLIQKTVEIAMEHGIIECKNLIVDSTHTKSCFNRKSAPEVLLEYAKQLRKAAYETDGPERGNDFPEKVSGNDLNEVIEYCRKLIDVIRQDEGLPVKQDVLRKVNLLEEIVDDNAEHLALSADEDARIGHKSADTKFFGFKTHYSMTEEGIIASYIVTSGNCSDGPQLTVLIEKARENGLEIDNVIGDAAYSGKDNLKLAKSEDDPDKKFNLISKLNTKLADSINDVNRNGFEYNKDADTVVCPAGHAAKRKKNHTKKDEDGKQVITYLFDMNLCRQCPMAHRCLKEGAKSKSYSITINADIHKEHHALQQTDEFKALAKNRYKIEAKNSELKNRHGLDTAYARGLHSMTIQSATTCFVANMKRIIKLIDEK